MSSGEKKKNEILEFNSLISGFIGAPLVRCFFYLRKEINFKGRYADEHGLFADKSFKPPSKKLTLSEAGENY
jgi:hypothetical protein